MLLFVQLWWQVVHGPGILSFHRGSTANFDGMKMIPGTHEPRMAELCCQGDTQLYFSDFQNGVIVFDRVFYLQRGAGRRFTLLTCFKRLELCVQ